MQDLRAPAGMTCAGLEIILAKSWEPGNRAQAFTRLQLRHSKPTVPLGQAVQRAKGEESSECS